MRLLRTAARASVATRVIGSTHRRQQQRWAAEDAQAVPAQVPVAAPEPAAPAAAPAPAGAGDPGVMIAQLQQLGQLRDSGVLTEAEFEAQKQRILGTA